MVAMKLQADRRLSGEQATPPATQKPLVKGLVHTHYPGDWGIVAAVGNHTQAYVGPTSPRA